MTAAKLFNLLTSRPALAGALLAALLLLAYASREHAVAIATLEATHTGNIATAIERGRREQAEVHAAQAAQIANMAREDGAALLAAVSKLAAEATARLARYDSRLRTLPPPACPPGQARQDAFNDLLSEDSR